jgi:hypothetical protein
MWKNNITHFLGFINLLVGVLLIFILSLYGGENLVVDILGSNSAYAVGYTLLCLAFIVQGLVLLWSSSSD